MGFPIAPHQISIVGSAHVEEQSPSRSLVMAGMPASPHQIAVLTPRSSLTAKAAAVTPTTFGLSARSRDGRSCGRTGFGRRLVRCHLPDLEDVTRDQAAAVIRALGESGTLEIVQ
jgi:hypothetical protein